MKRILCFITVAAVFMLMTAGITPSESANNSFNQGFEKHQQGDLVRAVKLYTKAIDDYPSFTMAFQMRAIAELQLKKYQQAINDYTMVITFGEPYFKAVGYYNRGVAKNMTRDFVGAILDFSQAIELDKKMASAFFHRGIAKSKIGDFAGQTEDFCRAAQLGDVDAERWLNTYYPSWKQNQPPPPIPQPTPKESPT